MVRLIAKVGLIVDFNMDSEESERALIDKFILGSVKQTAVLNLKKYGKIRVADIADMRYIAVQKEIKTVGDINLEDALFGGNGFANIFSK